MIICLLKNKNYKIKMDKSFEKIIEKNVLLLVDFILKKNPNANKEHIYHKLEQLNLLVRKHEIKFQGPNILETIKNRKHILKVKKSLFSNYILTSESLSDIEDAKFTVNLATKQINGTENSLGEIEPLNKKLIEICHKFKLKYVVPLNLNLDDDIEEEMLCDEIKELGLAVHDESDDNDE